MATIRVDVIGDSTSLKRALSEAGVAADGVGGSFAGLATKMAVLGASFLGATGIIDGFKKSVTAAEALNVATRQLDAQLRANGESVKAVAPYVADLNSRFEKLGFTSKDTEQAFTRLDRAGGSAAIAYKEMGVAADLARAKNISFQQAALLIGKVIDGTTSALNRYGIAIPKGTSATEALVIAQQKLAGQAAASVTPMQQFSAIITDLEAKIGNQLLPIINKYLDAVDAWLSKSQNQQAILKAVNSVINAMVGVVNQLSGAIRAMLPGIESFAGVIGQVVGKLGGWKPVIEGLIVSFVAWKAAMVALDVVMNFNPWIAAATALALAATYVVTHWEQVKTFFAGFMSWVRSNVVILSVFAPFLTLPVEIIAHWQPIKAAFEAIGSTVKTVFNGIYNTIKSVFEKILSIVSSVIDLIPNKILGISTGAGGIKAALAGWESLFKSAGTADGTAYSTALAAATKVANAPGGTGTGTGPGGYPFSPAPGTPGYKTPAGMQSGGLNDVGAFINDLILSVGGKPTTASKNALAQWQRMEGGSTNNPDSFNFLNTTLREPGSHGTGNVDGVQAYTSFTQGLSATVATLEHGYPAIVHAIATGDWTPTQELASELSKWSGGGYSAILGAAGAGGAPSGGPPGSTTLPTTGTTKKAPKPPAYKIPQALEASIRKAQDSFKNDVTAQHLGILDSLLAQEETLLKAHGDTAKAASVANEITDSQKKLADSFAKVATADVKAASADLTKAMAAFGKGQFGPAATYVNAEVKSLTEAKKEIEKAIAAAPVGDKAGYEKQLAAIDAELKDTKGVADWIEGVAKTISSFTAKLKTEGAAYTALLTQKTAASELQAVGYFADTAQTITGIDTAIVTSLEGQKNTLVSEENALKAKLASAPASLRAGLQAQITAIGGKVTSLTTDISNAMGTVEQDLAAAVQSAQQQFQTAVGNLQTDLDNQLQANAMNASGATADSAQLASMQAADQLKGLTDSIASAQKALDADTAAGSTATADQIAQDTASLASAKRQLDEYNLGIKAQAESTAATAKATQQTNDLNTALSGYEADLLSGKITAAQFTADLQGLQAQFGVTINDSVTPELVAVASAASGVASAFGALISWINSQTGSSIPGVGAGSGGTSSVTNAPGPPDSPNRGGTPNPPTTLSYNPTPSGGCFVAGTPVAAPGGSRPIEAFRPGDIVYVWDFAKSELVASEVEETFAHENEDERLPLLIETAAGSVLTTPEHPFWNGEFWIAAGELSAGSTVFGMNRSALREREVLSVKLLEKRQPVYNLHVTHPDHNYVAAGFLVHNVKANPVFAMGGVVPGPIGMPVFATVHGGELITPPGGLFGSAHAAQQASLWQNTYPSSGQGGRGEIHNHFNIAGSVISERELFNIVRRENQRTGSRNR